MMIDYIAAIFVIGSLFAVAAWCLFEFVDWSSSRESLVDKAIEEIARESVRKETLDATEVMAEDYRFTKAQEYA